MRKLMIKIKLYKNLLLLSLSLSLFVIFAGASLGIHWYLSGTSQAKALSEESLKTILKINQNLFQISELDEVQIFHLNTNLIQEQIKIADLEFPVKKKDLIKHREIIFEQVSERLTSIQNQLFEVQTQQQDLVYTMIFAAIFSLFFGVFIPSLLLLGLNKMAKKYKRNLEANVKSFLVDWKRESNQYQAPLQNPQFWLRISMLSLQYLGDFFQNSILANYVSEMAQEIYQELQKADSTASAVDEKGSKEQ